VDELGLIEVENVGEKELADQRPVAILAWLNECGGRKKYSQSIKIARRYACVSRLVFWLRQNMRAEEKKKDDEAKYQTFVGRDVMTVSRGTEDVHHG
jgi:hypothetical protein